MISSFTKFTQLFYSQVPHVCSRAMISEGSQFFFSEKHGYFCLLCITWRQSSALLKIKVSRRNSSHMLVVHSCGKIQLFQINLNIILKFVYIYVRNGDLKKNLNRHAAYMFCNCKTVCNFLHLMDRKFCLKTFYKQSSAFNC